MPLVIVCKQTIAYKNGFQLRKKMIRSNITCITCCFSFRFSKSIIILNSCLENLNNNSNILLHAVAIYFEHIYL